MHFPPNSPFFITLFFSCSLLFHPLLALPDPDAATVQPLFPNPSPSATIPAFPEQSDVAGCPLNLSDDLFHGIKTACAANNHDAELHRSRCCPVLAAWLYSAYSATALGRAAQGSKSAKSHNARASTTTTSYDMPLLPDDSETCVSDLGKALRVKGIDLFQPNESCDVVYCYCGIRLHPLSCPEAFSVNQNGQIVEDEKVRMLERNCFSTSSNVDQFPGLGGCSKCLNTLYQLNKKSSNSSKSQDRSTKIHNKDCELMGLTWLLAKNRSAYIHTVSGVLRALMLSKDGSDPKSCTLNSDGMPLAVDSSEFSDDQSSSFKLQPPISISISICFLLLLCLLLLHMHLPLLST